MWILKASMFSYFSPEGRVPVAHPLRSIKGYADAVLKSLSRDVDELYAVTGRPSIPPERLLKASLLIALYSVRSDRLFCEMLDYNSFAGHALMENRHGLCVDLKATEALLTETEAAKAMLDRP